MSEVEKLRYWVEQQKANGLVGLHYGLNDELFELAPDGMSFKLKNPIMKEDLCREINAFNEAAKNAVPFSFNDSYRNRPV